MCLLSESQVIIVGYVTSYVCLVVVGVLKDSKSLTRVSVGQRANEKVVHRRRWIY